MVRGQCRPTKHSCLTVQQLDTWPQGRSREGEAGNVGALCLWPYTEPSSALAWCRWVSRYHLLLMSAFLGSSEFQFGFKKGFIYLDTNREPGGQSAFSEQLLTLTVISNGDVGNRVLLPPLRGWVLRLSGRATLTGLDWELGLREPGNSLLEESSGRDRI